MKATDKRLSVAFFIVELRGRHLKEGVPTLGHVRGRDPTDTSYRAAMTKETLGGME